MKRPALVSTLLLIVCVGVSEGYLKWILWQYKPFWAVPTRPIMFWLLRDKQASGVLTVTAEVEAYVALPAP